MEGYVKLSRRVLEWKYFKDANCLKGILWLMCHAKYESNEPEYSVGDVSFTYQELAKGCYITYEQARTVIRKLKDSGVLKIKSTGNRTGNSTGSATLGSLDGWAVQEVAQKKRTPNSTGNRTPSYNKEIYKEDAEKIDFGKGGIRFHV